MQATSTGPNLTGSAVSPKGCQAMLEAVQELHVPGPINTSAQEEQRMVYIEEAESVGSVPSPSSLVEAIKTRVSKLFGKADPSIFLDKIGERIAFERGGTRLYDALATKYRALTQQSSDSLLPSVRQMAASKTEESLLMQGPEDETPLETLTRIRAEELSHFRMLCDAMEELGGDPTAQTPCADVTATASMGLIQVVTDPRTTLAQSLNAMVAAELIDNAGWELLATLADEAGKPEYTGQFLAALSEEQQHLAIVKGWLSVLVSERAGSLAV